MCVCKERSPDPPPVKEFHGASLSSGSLTEELRLHPTLRSGKFSEQDGRRWRKSGDNEQLQTEMEPKLNDLCLSSRCRE